MRHILLHSVVLLALSVGVAAQTVIPGKQVYIPSDLRSNDFESDTAQWSYKRMELTPDFAIFWERGFGDDLKNPPQLEGHDMTFDMGNLKQRLETFYAYYRDTLQFIRPGSVAERYRMMVMVNYSLDGTAYGGDYDEVIGAFWVAPNRIKDTRLNCVAHELGHSFQMQTYCDKKAQGLVREEDGRWFGGGFYEMASQWMLWHVNPDWIKDELFHWEAYKQQTHKALLHWENVYHTPYALEWWSQQHGLTIIGNIFREGVNPEDPAETYMRLTSQSVASFYDELFDAHRHTVFLDFRHARQQTRQYAGGFSTPLIDEARGYYSTIAASAGRWLRVPPAVAPESGGFNAICVPAPAKGSSISIDFEGITSAGGYNISLPTEAGWRYGFVALMADGTCQYSPIYNKVRGRATFTAPRSQSVEQLYLVVMGAPTSYRHISYPHDDDEPADSSRPATEPGYGQWPYRLRYSN